MSLILSELQIPKFVDISVLMGMPGTYIPQNEVTERDSCVSICYSAAFDAAAVAQDNCMCLPNTDLPFSDNENDGVSVYDITEFHPESTVSDDDSE